MKKIKIKCPAKINLDLKVSPLNKETGFHEIKSIMQSISLFDYLTINLTSAKEIKLSGTSNEIPYDENNLCYKASELFFKNIKYDYGCEIYIEKNIPIAAGLAGGSTDAMGVLYGLNKLFNQPLDEIQLNNLAITLGSDLNFCFVGGTKLCCGRGEKITELPFEDFILSLIKPKNFGISAKCAYLAFDELKTTSNMKNDLEFALLQTGKYPELEYLTSLGLQMSGSGPTYFLKGKNIDFLIDKNKYLIINDLHSINHGVIEV